MRKLFSYPCLQLRMRHILENAHEVSFIIFLDIMPFWFIISLGYKEDTDIAVKAAKNAFSQWKETSKEEVLFEGIVCGTPIDLGGR